METMQQRATLDRYLKLFGKFRDEVGTEDPAFIQRMRAKAISAFEQNGFPQKKEEDYRYTHLEPIFNGPLHYAFTAGNINLNEADVFRCDVPMLDSQVQLVLNGHYYRQGNSDPLLEDNGVVIGSLRAAIKRFPELVERHLGRYAAYEGEPFVALNSAFSRDGIFVYVPENRRLEKPIQVINLLLSDQNEMVQHRNLIILEKNATAEVILCDHTLSPQMFLTNSLTEAIVGENADLDILRLQYEHNNSCQVTNTWIHQAAMSRCQHGTITLHGGTIRNNLRIKLAGEGAETQALGLYTSDKNQHIDNHTIIDHLVPNCSSRQFYKGVLDDASKGAFNGMIHVHPDAQHTEAYQTNNNILLTDLAKMNTRPQLEIYADDVKCSHGATVGQLDEEALFYLRARGISANESRLLLMHAFVGEIISRIKHDALQERITELVSKRLRGELARCNNCDMQCPE